MKLTRLNGMSLASVKLTEWMRDCQKVKGETEGMKKAKQKVTPMQCVY